MGGCKSKDETADSIRKTPYKRGQDTLIKPKPSQIIDVNYQIIPNKFKRNQTMRKNNQSEIQGLVGLANLGNTCFINSAIQCLSNTQPLADYFISKVHELEINPDNPLSSKGQITQTFAQLVRSLWSFKFQYKTIQPYEFISIISQWGPQFAQGTQEDAHEFLAFLLDMIHEDLNRVKKKPYVEEQDYYAVTQEQADESWKGYLMRNRSIIVDLFQGQQKSSLKCLKCGLQSHRFEPFMYLSVPLQDNQQSKQFLEDCIREYCSEEKLTGEERWNCPSCKSAQESVKKIDLWSLPNILIIHMKRFQFTRNRRGKLRQLVDFPIVGLNFENLVLGKCNEPPTYDLYGVINHSGTLGTGHYYTHAKNREDMNWYLYNDSQISQESKDVQSQVVTNNGYLLFYFKNSVEEFQRQTLKSEKLITLEKKLTKHQSKIVFQKGLKNTLTKKITIGGIHIQQSEEISPKSESQIISVIQESRLDSSQMHEDSKVLGRRKSKKMKVDKKKTINNSHLSEQQHEDITERQRHIYDQNKEVKLKYLKSKTKKQLTKIHQLEPNQQ